MSYMFEVYYRPPANPTREANLTERVQSLGGWLDCREEACTEASQTICLTYEFNDHPTASRAADELRRLGEHVEGPQDYGP